MAKHRESISVSKDKVDSIEQIKKACDNFKLSFSSVVVELTIIGFESGKWGVLLDKKNHHNIYTTADIVHDDAQDLLTGDEEWVRL